MTIVSLESGLREEFVGDKTTAMKNVIFIIKYEVSLL